MARKVYRKKGFKGIEETPSLLGFGCMRFPKLNEDAPDIDEERAEAMLDYAYERGVDYFDTAYPYHHGLSEPFVGRVLSKYPRDSFYLASKMPGWEIESVEDARRIFYEQLERCQVEYFDYYLAHALNEKMFETFKLPAVMEFLYEMKREGRIRYLGFSFHDTPDVLETIIHAYEWDFVQLQINYLDWTHQDAKRQYEIVEEYGVPCIVMEPVRGGTLASLSEESRNIFKAHDPDVSIASWAIRYVASLPNVMVVLSGMSDMEQTKDNIETLTDFKPISASEQRVIDDALEAFLKKRTIPCTDCGYCMPCPEGVDIPGVFTLYNDYAISENENGFVRRYENKDGAASVCIDCGVCLEHCPQGIDIPARMREIESLYGRLKDE